MMETDDNYCPVCYESILNDNFTEFLKCNHRICSTCAMEFLFEKNTLRCPFDNMDGEIVCKSSNEVKTLKSIEEYRTHIWTDNKESLIEELESHIDLYFAKVIEEFQKMTSNLYETDNLFEKMIKCAEISADDMQHCKQLFNEESDILWREIAMCRKYSYNATRKIDIIENMWEKDKINTMQIDMGVIKNIGRYLVKEISTYVTFYEFKFLDENEDQNCYLHTIKKINNCDLKRADFSKRKLAAFVLSHYRKSTNFFNTLHPGLSGLETSKCLICLNETSHTSFGKFPECDHKICLSCLKEYLIVRGSCPFHSSNITDLNVIENSYAMIIQRKPALEYLEDNLLEISENAFKYQLANKMNLRLHILLNIMEHKNDIIEFINILHTFLIENKIKDNDDNKLEVMENLWKILITFFSTLPSIGSTTKSTVILREFYNSFTKKKFDSYNCLNDPMLCSVIKKNAEILSTKFEYSEDLSTKFTDTCMHFCQRFNHLQFIFTEFSPEYCNHLIEIEQFLVFYKELCDILNFIYIDNNKALFTESCLATILKSVTLNQLLERERIVFCLEKIKLWRR